MASTPFIGGTTSSFKLLRDEIDAEQHARETQYLIPTLMDKRSVLLDEEFYRGICDKLEDCAEDQHGLDIYQITAFYKHYHPQHGGSTEYYIFSILKALICCGIQTVGMCAFLYNAFILMPASTMVCTLNKPWELKTLATLLSLYVSAQMGSLIRVRKTMGLYEHIAHAPPFIGTEWLYLGLYANMFALIAAIYGSFILIYSTEDGVWMVLNAVALYFIMDLDVMMVDPQDYARIKRFMKHDFEYEEWFNDDWYDAEDGEIQFRKICGMQVQISGRSGGCGHCGTCLVVFGGLCMVAVTALGLLGAIAAPIAIAVCY